MDQLAIRITCEENPFTHKMFDDVDVLACREYTDKDKLHYHAFVDQFPIETMRQRLKRNFPGGNPVQACAHVRELLPYLRYVCKDRDGGVIVRNDYDYDWEELRRQYKETNHVKKELKKEFKKKSSSFKDELWDEICKDDIPQLNGYIHPERIIIIAMRLCKDHNKLPPSDFLMASYIEYIWNKNGSSRFLGDKIQRVMERLTPRNPDYFSEL